MLRFQPVPNVAKSGVKSGLAFPSEVALCTRTVQYRAWDVDGTSWFIDNFEIQTCHGAYGLNDLVDRQSIAAARIVGAFAAARSGANAKLRQIADVEVIPDDAAIAQISTGSPANIRRRNVEITPWTPECACRGPNGFDARTMIGEKPRALRYISR